MPALPPLADTRWRQLRHHPDLVPVAFMAAGRAVALVSPTIESRISILPLR